MSFLVPDRRPTRELLDDLDLAPEEMARSLADIELVNAVFGNARFLARRMRRGTGGGATPTVLDVGAGSGGVARRIAAALKREGVEATVVATDLRWRHLAAGRGQAGVGALPAAAADVFSLPFGARSVDWVVSTLLVHHFSPEENVRILREIARVARRGLLFLDLRRHRLPLLLISLTGRIAFRSRASVADGPASVRQAYTLEEAGAFAARALPGARVERVFPFWLLISHP